MTIKKVATVAIAVALAIGSFTALPATADNDGEHYSSIIAGLRADITALHKQLDDAASAKAVADGTIAGLRATVASLQTALATQTAAAQTYKTAAEAAIAALQADKAKDAATITALQAELAKAKVDAGTDKAKDLATIAALQAELAKVKVEIAAGGASATELKIKYNKLAKRFNHKVRKIHRVALLPLP
jgi:chromosome segregation ATPase